MTSERMDRKLSSTQLRFSLSLLLNCAITKAHRLIDPVKEEAAVGGIRGSDSPGEGTMDILVKYNQLRLLYIRLTFLTSPRKTSFGKRFSWYLRLRSLSCFLFCWRPKENCMGSSWLLLRRLVSQGIRYSWLHRLLIYCR